MVCYSWKLENLLVLAPLFVVEASVLLLHVFTLFIDKNEEVCSYLLKFKWFGQLLSSYLSYIFIPIQSFH